MVGRRERRSILEVDLALTVGDLVVGRLHVDAHALQGIDHLPAHAVRQVGADVEIAAVVMRLQRQKAAVRMGLEEEELQFWPHVVVVTHAARHAPTGA